MQFIDVIICKNREGKLQATGFNEKIQKIAQSLTQKDINPENKEYNELIKAHWTKKVNEKHERLKLKLFEIFYRVQHRLI